MLNEKDILVILNELIDYIAADIRLKPSAKKSSVKSTVLSEEDKLSALYNNAALVCIDSLAQDYSLAEIKLEFIKRFLTRIQDNYSTLQNKATDEIDPLATDSEHIFILCLQLIDAYKDKALQSTPLEHAGSLPQSGAKGSAKKTYHAALKQVNEFLGKKKVFNAKKESLLNTEILATAEQCNKIKILSEQMIVIEAREKRYNSGRYMHILQAYRMALNKLNILFNGDNSTLLAFSSNSAVDQYIIDLISSFNQFTLDYYKVQLEATTEELKKHKKLISDFEEANKKLETEKQYLDKSQEFSSALSALQKVFTALTAFSPVGFNENTGVDSPQVNPEFIEKTLKEIAKEETTKPFDLLVPSEISFSDTLANAENLNRQIKRAIAQCKPSPFERIKNIFNKIFKNNNEAYHNKVKLYDSLRSEHLSFEGNLRNLTSKGSHIFSALATLHSVKDEINKAELAIEETGKTRAEISAHIKYLIEQINHQSSTIATIEKNSKETESTTQKSNPHPH